MARERACVLIVDDQLDNLRILAGILGKAGYQVRALRDSAMVLPAVLAEPPDLVLLDVRMPGADGYEVCSLLKAHERSREIPVVFLSALDGVADKVRGFSCGGVDYVTKPFEPDEVLARLRTHLELRRLQRELMAKNERLEEEVRERVAAQAQLSTAVGELEEALARVRQLSGLLPICCHCKKIRTDQGQWQDVAHYIMDNSEARCSHGICPACLEQHYGDLME